MLRGLRQRVELARMDARGDEEVARALGRGRRQDRGGELVEAAVVHPAADGADDIEPAHDVGVQGLAPQVEESILQAQVLRVVGLAKDRDRQLLRRRQHLDFTGHDLDLASGEIWIDRRFGVDDRPLAHLAVDADDPFRADALRLLESGAVGIGDHLGEAVVVAQVDEQQAAVVAHPMHPA